MTNKRSRSRSPSSGTRRESRLDAIASNLRCFDSGRPTDWDGGATVATKAVAHGKDFLVK